MSDKIINNDEIIYISSKSKLSKRKKLVWSIIFLTLVIICLIENKYFLAIISFLGLYNNVVLLINHHRKQFNKIIINKTKISKQTFIIIKFLKETILWDNITDIDYGYRYTKIITPKNIILIDSNEYEEDYLKIKDHLKQIQKDYNIKRII